MTHKVDWDKVDQMLVSGSKGTEVSAELGMQYETLAKHCLIDKKMDFQEYLRQKRSKGNAMIHAAQFHTAIKTKNPTMLIWLGKQRLGQKEVTEESAIAPKQGEIDKDQLIMQLKHELAELKINADKS